MIINVLGADFYSMLVIRVWTVWLLWLLVMTGLFAEKQWRWYLRRRRPSYRFSD